MIKIKLRNHTIYQVREQQSKKKSKPNVLVPLMAPPLTPKFHQTWISINHVLLSIVGDTNQFVQRRAHPYFNSN